MKAIQKAVIILLIAVMLCGMTGCMRWTPWPLSQDDSEIAEISIIYITRYIEVEGYEELQPEYEVVKVIDKEDYKEFLNEYRSLPHYFSLVGHPRGYPGYNENNILITYKNGEMDLFAQSHPVRIKYDGNGILYGYSVGENNGIPDDFVEFIEKWLNK